MFDVAVIGLGMIGSAALRYLSKPETGLRAVGVGPAEPQDWATHQGAFASHYDQARITRVTDPDTIWATLAQRAMNTYAEIERSSGMQFHYPVGHLRINPRPDREGNLFDTAEAIGRMLDAPLERLDSAHLAAQFPYLRIPDTAEGLYEHGGAGFINPRALVAAQLTIAAAQGATMVREEVAQLARADQGFVLTTSSGQTVRAKRVLISAHGYTNALVQPLLNRALDLVSMAHTTVYAAIADAQVQELSAMPSVIWPVEGHPALESIYTTPAMRYPDGRVYLKTGGPLFTHPILDTPESMLEWFHSAGNPIEIEALQEVLLTIMPNLDVQGWSSKPCMNTYTSHGYPYVDQLDENLFLCTGGCGSGAKSSNEIGRMGALLAQHGAWTCDLPASDFRAVYMGA
ncbi:MAG TPA: FAD-dependent oxidoreductase [Roseiflexaceae bacterium]|jgi:sarcosine oxidase|nr:FAD-dependent oxidoreductase [Roseiflexaceae bacterium]